MGWMQGLVSAERNGYFANQLWQIEPIAVSHHKRHKRVALKSHWRQRLRKAILHRHKKGVGVSENAGKDFAGDEVRSSVLLQPKQNTSAAENASSAERRVYGTRGDCRPEDTLSYGCRLVKDFGKLFSVVAGQPQRMDSHSSKARKAAHRFRILRAARELMARGSAAGC